MRAARRTAAAVRHAAALAFGALLGAALVPAASAAEEPPPEFYGVVSQAGLADEDFARMRANGISLMRLQLSWKKVQPEESDCEGEGVPVPPGFPLADACDWSYYDRIVGGAAAAGVEVMPYLLSVPEFISEHENAPPIRSAGARQAWSEWVQRAVGRYGPGGAFWSEEYPSRHPGAEPLPIRRWQIWNEPSDATYWHPRPNPSEYGDLVELTAAAIRSVDPAAETILAGLFGTPNRANGGIRVKPFLRELLGARDLGAHFDSLALHPYGPNLKRSKQQVRMARKVLRRFGLHKRPLWITELGWASGGDHGQLSKTPRRQARLVKRAYRLYERRRKRWSIAGITWFAWQDTSDRAACVFCSHAGLVTLERRAKPALGAYRRIALGG